MANTAVCPKCGKSVEHGSLGGICAACLMKAGLDKSWIDSHTQSFPSPAASGARFVPPSAEQLSMYFPQLEMVRLLGHGGMGAVYLARQKSLDRLVALKIIRPESAAVQAFADRFAREARALARLNHPNIVGIYDFGSVSLTSAIKRPAAEQDDEDTSGPQLFFLLMEYIDGANLRQLIAEKNLSSREALAIVPQICEALQFAHDQGVVHRDIKPENILLDQKGRVKIADFGLAKLMVTDSIDHSLTGTHQVMGTPRYMAPEQLEQSRSIDHRADIYSLGVVFYEMLTGELPIGVFEPPSHKVQIDVRLDQVVLRSLAKEPDRRYQHASEFKTDIEAASSSSDGEVPLENFSAGRQSDLIGKKVDQRARVFLRAQLVCCFVGMVSAFTPDLHFASFWGLSRYGSGNDPRVTISLVDGGSPAWKAGFRPKDEVITPPDMDGMNDAVANLAGGKGSELFTVERDGKRLELLVEPVARSLGAVAYTSEWFPVAGWLFFATGLAIFVGGNNRRFQKWMSPLSVFMGLALLTGCVVILLTPHWFGFVVWQRIPFEQGQQLWTFGQDTITAVAGLALLAFGVCGIRSVAQIEDAVPRTSDVSAIIARPANALFLLGILAIPALLLTALLLFLIPLLGDAAGF